MSDVKCLLYVVAMSLVGWSDGRLQNLTITPSAKYVIALTQGNAGGLEFSVA